MTDAESLRNSTKWLALVDEYCPNNTLKILCGNKVDKFADRAVSTNTASRFASDYEFNHNFEVSAKEGTELDSMVQQIG